MTSLRANESSSPGIAADPDDPDPCMMSPCLALPSPPPPPSSSLVGQYFLWSSSNLRTKSSLEKNILSSAYHYHWKIPIT